MKWMTILVAICIALFSGTSLPAETGCRVSNGDFEEGQLGEIPLDWLELDTCAASNPTPPPTCVHEMYLVNTHYFDEERSLYMHSRVTDAGVVSSNASFTDAWTSEWINCPEAASVKFRISGFAITHSESWGWANTITLRFTDGMTTEDTVVYAIGEFLNYNAYEGTETGADGATWYMYDKPIPQNIDKTHMKIAIRCKASTWTWSYDYSDIKVRIDGIQLMVGCGIPTGDFEKGQLGEIPLDWLELDTCTASNPTPPPTCVHEMYSVDTRYFSGSQSLYMHSRVTDAGVVSSNASCTDAWTSEWINCPEAVSVKFRIRNYGNTHSESWGWANTVTLRFTDGETTEDTVVYAIGEFLNYNAYEGTETGADGATWYMYDKPIPLNIDKTHMKIAISCTASTWTWSYDYSDIKFYLDDMQLILCDCMPGEADGSGNIDIDDVVYLIDYIFGSGPAAVPYGTCSGDATCDCVVDIDDAVHLIQYIFSTGPLPCSCQDWLAACGMPLRH